MNWPGMRMVMHPGAPKAHASTEVLFKAGMLPSNTVGDPGIQGAGVTGMHGTGRRRPHGCGSRRHKSRISRRHAHPKGRDVNYRFMVHDISRRLVAGHHPVLREHDKGGGPRRHGEHAFQHRAVTDMHGHTDTSRKRAENDLLCIAHSNLDRQELNPCTSLSNICT